MFDALVRSDGEVSTSEASEVCLKDPAQLKETAILDDGAGGRGGGSSDDEQNNRLALMRAPGAMISPTIVMTMDRDVRPFVYEIIF